MKHCPCLTLSRACLGQCFLSKREKWPAVSVFLLPHVYIFELLFVFELKYVQALSLSPFVWYEKPEFDRCESYISYLADSYSVSACFSVSLKRRSVCRQMRAEKHCWVSAVISVYLPVQLQRWRSMLKNTEPRSRFRAQRFNVIYEELNHSVSVLADKDKILNHSSKEFQFILKKIETMCLTVSRFRFSLLSCGALY